MTALSLGLIVVLLLWTPDIQCDDTDKSPQLDASTRAFIEKQSHDIIQEIVNHDGVIVVHWHDVSQKLDDMNETMNNLKPFVNQSESRLLNVEAMLQFQKNEIQSTQNQTKKAFEEVMEAIQGVTAAIISMNRTLQDHNVVDIVVNRTNLVENKIEAVEDRVNSLFEDLNKITRFFNVCQASKDMGKIQQKDLLTLLNNSTEEMQLLGDRISKIEDILTKTVSGLKELPKVSGVKSCRTDDAELTGAVIREIVDFKKVTNQLLAELAVEIINQSKILQQETNTSIRQSRDERQAMKSFVIDVFNRINTCKGDTNDVNTPRELVQDLDKSVEDSGQNKISAEEASLPSKSFKKITNDDIGELQQQLLKVWQYLDVEKNILVDIKPSSTTPIALKKKVEEIYNRIDMILKRLPSVDAPLDNSGKAVIESKPAKDETPVLVSKDPVDANTAVPTNGSGVLERKEPVGPATTVTEVLETKPTNGSGVLESKEPVGPATTVIEALETKPTNGSGVLESKEPVGSTTTVIEALETKPTNGSGVLESKEPVDPAITVIEALETKPTNGSGVLESKEPVGPTTTVIEALETKPTNGSGVLESKEPVDPAITVIEALETKPTNGSGVLESKEPVDPVTAVAARNETEVPDNKKPVYSDIVAPAKS